MAAGAGQDGADGSCPSDGAQEPEYQPSLLLGSGTAETPPVVSVVGGWLGGCFTGAPRTQESGREQLRNGQQQGPEPPSSSHAGIRALESTTGGGEAGSGLGRNIPNARR